MNSTKHLRVLQVGKFYPPHMGGMETHLQALCRSLCESVDLRVVVANDGRCTQEEVVYQVPICRVGTLLTLASSPICPTMAARIRTSRADLVHIHVPGPAAILAYLTSGHPGRLVFTYHSDTVRQKVLGALFHPVLQAALRRSAAIIATSPNYLESSPVLAAYREKCHVIPYGIPIEQFAHCPSQPVARLRSQYGGRLVLSIGRLVYYKGFEYLIHAMQRINGTLILIGAGPLRAKLERLASELGIPRRVHFLGEIQNEDVIPYYHAADVFVLPSVARSEAFGIVQIEAMAAGKPVVNTALDSGVPFVSLHGVTGFTVPPASHEALAAAVSTLLDDAELRGSYGTAARLRAQKEFSLETMASRTLRLYQKVMVNTHKAPLELSPPTADPA